VKALLGYRVFKNPAGKSARPVSISEEDWEELDLKTASLCLTDEVMYNMMDEEMATSLWSRL